MEIIHLLRKTLTFEGAVTKIQELNKEAVQRILKHGTAHHE